MTIEQALAALGPHGHHGAEGYPEGAVWRLEDHHPRQPAKLNFRCKYVDPRKEDGALLPEMSGKDPVWNWRP
jgi:hypothetical protein